MDSNKKQSIQQVISVLSGLIDGDETALSTSSNSTSRISTVTPIGGVRPVPPSPMSSLPSSNTLDAPFTPPSALQDRELSGSKGQNGGKLSVKWSMALIRPVIDSVFSVIFCNFL